MQSSIIFIAWRSCHIAELCTVARARHTVLLEPGIASINPLLSSWRWTLVSSSNSLIWSCKLYFIALSAHYGEGLKIKKFRGLGRWSCWQTVLQTGSPEFGPHIKRPVVMISISSPGEGETGRSWSSLASPTSLNKRSCLKSAAEE